MSAKLFYLDEIKSGQKAEVKEIHSGHNAADRLAEMGIVPGTVVKVVASYPFKGPVIIEVDGTRMALGRGLARRIKVSDCGKETGE